VPAAASDSRGRVRAVLLFGAFYLAVGIVTAALAKGASSHAMVVAWRLAAWVTSGVAFAAHIAYQQMRLRTPPRVTALHAALAAALGAGALAAAALARAAATGTGRPRLLAIAIVVWPVMTFVPAFLAALASATLLDRVRPRS
jgi:hypothetical protein